MGLTPNPTLVAILELQLQLLQNADAAVPPMKSKQPENREEPMAPMPPVKSGMERRAPIVGERESERTEGTMGLGLGSRANAHRR